MIMYKKEIMELAVLTASKIKIDIPICAIIEKNGKVISIQTNKKEENNLTTAHAEILAIQEANKLLNSWRLEDCNLYVTLEPCPMCAWAILNARIKNVYFGSYDTKYGAFGGAINLANLANSKTNIQGGLLEEECNDILAKYFKELRNEKKT